MMLPALIASYATGFLLMTVIVEGSKANKLSTAAIWPFWIMWCWGVE